MDDGLQAVEAAPEPEPVVVETRRNGNGPPVEIATDNGHGQEAAEGQQSLFSWAEFLAEEPAQPTGRNGKPKPASTSLVNYGLEVGQKLRIGIEPLLH